MAIKFPSDNEKQRITNYDHYDDLYFGRHFKAFSIKAKDGFPKQYAKLRYVVANFPGLISRVIADMLFGSPLVVDVKDQNTQDWLNGLIDDNHLMAQLYESSLANSRRGDDIFKIRGENLDKPGESKIYIEQVNTDMYFPEFDRNSARMSVKRHVIAWTWEDAAKVCYLQKEIHEPGKIINEIYTYNKESGEIIATLGKEELFALTGLTPEVQTKVDKPLVFHIPNTRDGSGFFGTSDYNDLEELFFALNNRITKVDNILDKHSDPILAVPPGVLDEKGQVKKERFGMFEVDNDNAGFNKPEYIVWNANLDSAFKEIEKVTEMLFMFSETSPSTMGLDKGGQAESGRALKFKMLRTIAKRDRKRTYYDIAIKEMLEVAQEFGKAWKVSIDDKKITKVEKPTLKWSDGVITDLSEEIDNAVKRIDAGLSSKADEIAKIDDMKPEDAKKKVEEIESESKITIPPIGNTPGQNNNTPGA